ncbi:MAG: histidinol dehydrogenase, partial [Chloroflexota bacterium]|nr:histidinol dehydrogenase [Chloroflexota bacterium]
MPLAIYHDIEVARKRVLRRQDFDALEVVTEVQTHSNRIFGEGATPAQVVERIVAEVRARGDDALRFYTRELDGVELDRFAVEGAELEDAVRQLDPDLVEALRLAAERIERFHMKQGRQSWVEWGAEGVLGQIVVPLERVGIYVPGGSAPLPSSLLMAAIPARVAGVDEIVVCSPAQRDTGTPSPLILAAAHIAGVRTVYSVGGAQAIAAMAYGTESVGRVDKIVGPGNIFVVLAKRAVFGVVDIEALPGPTETMVIADAHADPRLAAADLLAQAE